jgi:hypothetical protein
MEIVSLRRCIIVGFISRRALIFGGVHVMGAEVAADCVAVSLVIGYRYPKGTGRFDEVLCTLSGA